MRGEGRETLMEEEEKKGGREGGHEGGVGNARWERKKEKEIMWLTNSAIENRDSNLELAARVKLKSTIT